MPLRAMSLNLFGHHADWPARREVLAAGLRSLRPDVVALQETVWGEGTDQAVELLGRDTRWPGTRGGRRTGSGRSWPAAGRWARSGRWTCT